MLRVSNIGFGSYHREGEKIGPSVWNFHDLIIVIEGRIFMRAGSCNFYLNKNDGIIVPPNNHFVGHTLSQGTIIWVMHFHNYHTLPAFKFLLKKTPFTLSHLLADPFYRQCLEKIHEAEEANPVLSKNEVFKSLILLLLTHARTLHRHSPEISPARKPFDEVVAWARDRLADGIQVQNMAAKAGLSESHFRKQFRGHYGIPPSTLLRNLRIQEAKRLLQQTRYPIKEISRLTGYADAVSFHRAFQSTGITPAKYRAALPKVV